MGKKKEKQKKKRKQDTKKEKGRTLGTILKLIKKAKTKIKQQELINFQSSIKFKKQVVHLISQVGFHLT